MLPDVAIPTYDSAYGSLGSVYDPQTSQVNTEISQLQPQQDAQQASLDQAKVNAFRDITTAANNKGMLFSGFSPDQQAQYVGTKYLPAVANLKATFQNNKNTLLDKINAINAQRSQQAQGIVSSAQSASANNMYKNAQLALAQQRTAASLAKSSQPAPLSQNQLVGAIRQGLTQVRGKDGKVSPQDFAAAYHTFAGAGYNPSDFYKYFQGFMDPNNNYYDYAIKTYKA